jgi:hypothetical protein
MDQDLMALPFRRTGRRRIAPCHNATPLVEFASKYVFQLL